MCRVPKRLLKMCSRPISLGKMWAMMRSRWTFGSFRAMHRACRSLARSAPLVLGGRASEREFRLIIPGRFNWLALAAPTTVDGWACSRYQPSNFVTTCSTQTKPRASHKLGGSEDEDNNSCQFYILTAVSLVGPAACAVQAYAACIRVARELSHTMWPYVFLSLHPSHNNWSRLGSDRSRAR
jgi:hypothetical protein